MSVKVPESRFVDVAGTAIHYHDMGQGPVLIMLHGSGPGASGWSNYNRNAEQLSRSWRVIIPDLPGFGKSDMKPVDGAIPGWWANAVVGLMDGLGIEKASFVGNSMGGMVTLKIALTNPDRVDRMVLMGPGGGTPVFSIWPTPPIITLMTAYEGEGINAAKVRAFISACLYDQSVITDELIAQRLEAALDPRIVAQPPMRIGPAGPFEELWRDPAMGKLQHQTLIIWGREDRVLPLDTGMILLKQLPNAQLQVFPKCGHWAQWEHPGRFNRVVASFLAAEGDN